METSVFFILLIANFTKAVKASFSDPGDPYIPAVEELFLRYRYNSQNNLPGQTDVPMHDFDTEDDDLSYKIEKTITPEKSFDLSGLDTESHSTTIHGQFMPTLPGDNYNLRSHPVMAPFPVTINPIALYKGGPPTGILWEKQKAKDTREYPEVEITQGLGIPEDLTGNPEGFNFLKECNFERRCQGYSRKELRFKRDIDGCPQFSRALVLATGTKARDVVYGGTNEGLVVRGTSLAIYVFKMKPNNRVPDAIYDSRLKQKAELKKTFENAEWVFIVTAKGEIIIVEGFPPPNLSLWVISKGLVEEIKIRETNKSENLKLEGGNLVVVVQNKWREIMSSASEDMTFDRFVRMVKDVSDQPEDSLILAMEVKARNVYN